MTTERFEEPVTATVTEAIGDRHLVACVRPDWVTGLDDRYDAIFNPDNVVSVTES